MWGQQGSSMTTITILNPTCWKDLVIIVIQGVSSFPKLGEDKHAMHMGADKVLHGNQCHDMKRSTVSPQKLTCIDAGALKGVRTPT